MSVYLWFKTTVLIGVFYCLGCAKIPDPPVSTADLELKRIPVESLPGFETDKVGHALLAFKKSCKKIANKNLNTRFGSQPYSGLVKDWVNTCTSLPAPGAKSVKYRQYLINNFKAYKIVDTGNSPGLFTGYFEPILKGSLIKTKNFSIPIYPRPFDLILVSLGDWRKSMKGKRIAGKLVGPRLKPYFTRKEIREGALVGTTKPIIWLSSDIDAFFLHIQGSGKIKLPDGSQVRIGYAGHNGHNYFPIGRYLKKIGAISSAEMSLQKIKSWLIQNPKQKNLVMDLNPSYIFFRHVASGGPIGAQGLALTPGRSLAVDRKFFPLGMLLWLDADYSDEEGLRLQRMMVAQDTGGAIKGPIRGDVFWGSGEKALELAGPMKAEGNLFILIPKTVSVFSN
tara:strand:+ start:205 stop:1389 length:1185 start_codon:yes stop_codon:yes gene_type:complete